MFNCGLMNFKNCFVRRYPNAFLSAPYASYDYDFKVLNFKYHIYYGYVNHKNEIDVYLTYI
jgi:hypothetical protein